MTSLSIVRYQKKRNESDLEMHYQKLVSLKSECGFYATLNFSIFVREYGTRRPDISYSKEIYVTKLDLTHHYAKD